MADREWAAQLLKQHQISPTYQRLVVLEELAGRRDHPAAEDIWAALSRQQPPIAKATVYNTLKLLSDKGIIRPIYIDGDTLRYDVELDGHGHFHCERCGKIFNFPTSVEQPSVPELDGFHITQRDLYFRGECPACQASAQ